MFFVERYTSKEEKMKKNKKKCKNGNTRTRTTIITESISRKTKNNNSNDKREFLDWMFFLVAIGMFEFFFNLQKVVLL